MGMDIAPSVFTVLSISAAVALFVLFYLWGTYNAFVTKRNQVKTDFSDVEVQIKRRASLIERLASLVQEYAKHEKDTFEGVTKARSALDTSKTVKDTAKAENMLTQTLKSLFMVTENYPKLQASQNFLSLRDDLKETEDKIAAYREGYNVSVQDYNNLVQTFPNLLAAELFQFREEELFQA